MNISSLLMVSGALAAAGLLTSLHAEDSGGRNIPPMLQRYFEQQVSGLERPLEVEITSKDDWLAKKDEYRRQLAEMLGLDPRPKKTDLQAAKTGEFEHEGIVVENLHYQSMPGLYVTANLYRPKVVDKPLPTILYVCGHATVAKNGVTYGNKAGYEHHGEWYAKHGFVCLVIDTVELGELHGEHHGTYGKGRWWWISRGYTPAGVEAWAGIRGLDYLETRPEVDKSRFGVTGRSGGGAYSWWIAALDERIKAAVPTAGITTLRNYVVDGCVEGHCDCMFMVNTYHWDYDKVAALVAPRALCIANTDKDTIFPFDGVYHVYQSVRRIYKLLGAEKNIGIQIAEGPHQDSQPLNTGEFHWMTRFLQGADPMSTLDAPAVKSIPVEKLKVFKENPAGEVNTRADEVFVPMAVAPVIADTREAWAAQRLQWMNELRAKCFGESAASMPLPEVSEVLKAQDTVRDVVLESYDLDGYLIQNGPNPRIYKPAPEERNPLTDAGYHIWLAHSAKVKPQDLDLVVLNILDDKGWQEFANTYAGPFPKLFPTDVKIEKDDKAFEQEKKMFDSFKWGMAFICPRGVGPTAFANSTNSLGQKKLTQILRRFYLIGQTLDGQQVRDIRCAIEAFRSIEGLKNTKLWLQAERTQAGNALYASLFEDNIARIDLHNLPHSHMPVAGDSLPPTDPNSKTPSTEAPAPVYLNVLKYLDIPQAVAMACERTRVVIFDDNKAAWTYPKQMAEKFEWGKDKKAGLQLRDVPKE